MPLTITEALAEIKTINKRLIAKRNSIMPYLARQDGVKDPLEKEGGSVEFIRREQQAISDLETRIITLRAGISKANDETIVEVGSRKRSISDWLTWRREISPLRQAHNDHLQRQLTTIRNQAHQNRVNVVKAGETATAAQDFIINLDEGALVKEIEEHQEILGYLDGQLSLKNATTIIED